jgi:hypothetical protein
MVIIQNQQMTRIAFGITRSKINDTGALNVRMISAYYLQNYLSQSLDISHTDWS